MTQTGHFIPRKGCFEKCSYTKFFYFYYDSKESVLQILRIFFNRGDFILNKGLLFPERVF